MYLSFQLYILVAVMLKEFNIRICLINKSLFFYLLRASHLNSKLIGIELHVLQLQWKHNNYRNK